MTMHEQDGLGRVSETERVLVLIALTVLLSSVPIAMTYMTSLGFVLPGVIAGASDFLIWTTYLTACGMLWIWVGLSHRYDLWQHYGHFVLVSSGLEILSMGFQRLHYWLYRVTEVYGRCQFGDRIDELCNMHDAIAHATIIPATLQWVAAVALLGICSPILAEYFGRYWYLTGAALLNIIWTAGFILILWGAP